MAESSTTIIVQLFTDWEIQLLILLSFALQLFLFFFGSLRRCNKNWLLGLLLWLAYLSADSIALYALGYLSRNMPTTTQSKLNQPSSSQTHQLTLLWAPFLLIHLGGQDTVTAFSIEDNELWLRHLQNLLVQMSLVLYVLWQSVTYDRLVVPAVFVFLAGMIKYGERIWALKSGSQKALRSSTRSPAVKLLPVVQGGATGLIYQIVVKQALATERGLHDAFVARKFDRRQNGGYFQIEDAQKAFKVVEIWLSIMYDQLFTKGMMIQTTLGAILRCISLTSTIVSFVLFIVMSAKQRYKYTIVDATTTYILFIGAFCLEGCAIFNVMMSPRAWALMEGGGRGCRMLARVAWSIQVRIQPETRSLWSNSMGQYNLLSSCMADKSSIIAKMMGVVGGDEVWKNIRHTKHAKVTAETKKLIHETLIQQPRTLTLSMRASLHRFTDILELPFEQSLLYLHVWTDYLLYKGKIDQEEMQVQPLMDTCKGISDYMMYLLVLHPAMLPLGRGAQSALAYVSEHVRSTPAVSSKEQYLEAADKGLLDSLQEQESENFPVPMEQRSPNMFNLQVPNFFPRPAAETLFRWAQSMPQEPGGFLAALETLQQVWVRVLFYAAGKSRPEEHARRLSMGGELLTFVWLLMLRRGLGDQSTLREVDLVQPDGVTVTPDSTVFLFNFHLDR